MVKLSAVIITLNEEKNIARCLDSLTGLVDEIVVIDSFSTDRTQEICLERGARFLTHTFEGYVQQIRYAIPQASHDLVLSIDADEALSPVLRAAILAVKQAPQFDAYECERLNYYCEKPIRHGAWHPDRKVRLWRAGSGGYGGTNPHYKYELHEGGRLGRLNGKLLHYSYDSFDGLVSQAVRFSKIAADEAYDQGKRVSLPGLLLRPLFRFKRDYFLKAGFLDGMPGLLIAAISAFGNFLKYTRLYEMHAGCAAKEGHADRI
ncbi:MAG: glycosyltransferase family 2 protein [Fibrobacterota bacterium]